MKVKKRVEISFFFDSQKEKKRADLKAVELQKEGYIREGHHEYSYLGRPKMTYFFEKQEEG